MRKYTIIIFSMLTFSGCGAIDQSVATPNAVTLRNRTNLSDNFSWRDRVEVRRDDNGDMVFDIYYAESSEPNNFIRLRYFARDNRPYEDCYLSVVAFEGTRAIATRCADNNYRFLYLGEEENIEEEDFHAFLFMYRFDFEHLMQIVTQLDN